jgi:hypothetical protein
MRRATANARLSLGQEARMYWRSGSFRVRSYLIQLLAVAWAP